VIPHALARGLGCRLLVLPRLFAMRDGLEVFPEFAVVH